MEQNSDHYRDLVSFYANVVSRLEGLEKRIEVLERSERWLGPERRSENLFSDKQTERIKEVIRNEALVETGKSTRRLLLLALGALVSGFVGFFIAKASKLF
jgi:hypothetical protein